MGVRTALAAQGDDLGFELRRRLAWLTVWSGGAILEALREAGGLGTFEPFADGFFADAESGGSGAERGAVGQMRVNQFSSREWSEYGISVHSVREG